MISLFKLFEGFTSTGRWIPYPSSAVKKLDKPYTILNKNESDQKVKTAKKVYSSHVEDDKIDLGRKPPKAFSSRRSYLPSYPKGRF